MAETSYFQWLCDLIICDKADKSYYSLCKLLYDKKFIVKIARDENRMVDGWQFKQDYINYCNNTIGVVVDMEEHSKILAEEQQFKNSCSILEMIMGISKRMAFELAEFETGDLDFPIYFWEIIQNLGLDKYDDEAFGENYMKFKIEAEDIIKKLNDRKYNRDGSGGMFPIQGECKDQRKVEIWYQMQTYINEKYSIMEV